MALTGTYLLTRAIGSEFLPHLDEGAIWVRGTLPASTGPTEGERLMAQARLVLTAFPEVTQVVSQVGRPDDGTDPTGFFNAEFLLVMKDRSEWRKRFNGEREQVLAGPLD